jgi:peptidoglycan hydrolase CwlO-like protein
MTNHVSHTNTMVNELKEQYQGRISQLQQKITEQQKEILQLQEQIKLLSYVKEYDC